MSFDSTNVATPLRPTSAAPIHASQAAPSIIDRARKYLEVMDPAISGNEGHPTAKP